MNGLEALLNWMTFVKVSVATVMVVGLSLLAEKLGPRTAGLLSGFPLGVAITLFFVGLELGPDFAARSAVFTAVGLVATQSFAYAYYQATVVLRKRRRPVTVLLSSLWGMGAYFFVAWLLRQWEWNPVVAVTTAVAGTALFARLFRGVQDTRIETLAQLTIGAILFRAFAAAVFVVCITSFAGVVGPHWAGLFSAFPITMLPFVVIIHWLYRPENVHTILKHVPRGIASIIVYAVAVLVCYPRCGVMIGTLIAYAGSALYLSILEFPRFKGRAAAQAREGIAAS